MKWSQTEKAIAVVLMIAFAGLTCYYFLIPNSTPPVQAAPQSTPVAETVPPVKPELPLPHREPAAPVAHVPAVIQLNPGESVELKATGPSHYGHDYEFAMGGGDSVLFEKTPEKVDWQVSDPTTFSVKPRWSDTRHATVTAANVRKPSKGKITLTAQLAGGVTAKQMREVEIVTPAPEVQVRRLAATQMQQPGIAIDKAGLLHAVEPAQGYKGGINYAWQTPNGWDELPSVDDESTRFFSRMFLEIDSAGTPHVVMPSSEKLVYMTVRSGAWHKEEIAAGYCGVTDFAIDAQDRLHLAFNGSDDVTKNNLQYAMRDKAGWQIEMVDRSPDKHKGGLQEAHGLTVDLAGNTYISYMFFPKVDYAQWDFEEGVGSYGPTRAFRLAQRKSGKWTTESLPGFEREVHYAMPLVAPDGTVHILLDKYRKEFPYHYPAVASKRKGVWSFEAIDGEPTINQYIGMRRTFALDEQQRLCLLVFNDDRGQDKGISWLRREDNSWKSYVVSPLGRHWSFQFDLIDGQLQATFLRDHHERALWRATLD